MLKKKHPVLKVFLFIGVSILIVIALLLTSGFISGKLRFEKDADGKIWLVVDNTTAPQEYEQIAEAMKDEYPTDLFVYGEDCHFDDCVPYTAIREISSDAVKSDKAYKAIVINDMYGNTALTEADYDLLYRLVIEGEYSLAYIGKAKLKTFVEKGFIEDYFNSDDAGFQIRNYNGYEKTSIGFWTDTSQAYFDEGSVDLLEDTLLTLFLKNIYRGR